MPWQAALRADYSQKNHLLPIGVVVKIIVPLKDHNFDNHAFEDAGFDIHAPDENRALRLGEDDMQKNVQKLGGPVPCLEPPGWGKALSTLPG